MINGFTMNGVDLDTMLVPRSYFNQGTLWNWGTNYYYGLGDNTNSDRYSPVQTVAGGIGWKQAGTGKNMGAGIKTDGTLWTWGSNQTGCLGDNTVIAKSSPVQTIASGTNWRQLSIGGWFQSGIAGQATVMATKTDGSLWGWGRNSYGQIGDNTTTQRNSPVIVGGTAVAGSYNWSQVSTQLSCTAAIKTDGTLWTWGRNTDGQLGNNNTSSFSSPVQTVASGNNWRQVAAGSYTMGAVKTDGTLWMWGKNNYGQLGNNTTINRSSPIQTIASGNNWKQVSIGGAGFPGAAGYTHVAAIKTDGTLWTWGTNNSGQLGNNTTIYYSSPIQTISAGTNWKTVAAGYMNTLAIKTDGSLWLWGNNGAGQLGDNTATNRSSPIQTVASGYSWSQVGSGYYQSIAITSVYN